MSFKQKQLELPFNEFKFTLIRRNSIYLKVSYGDIVVEGCGSGSFFWKVVDNLEHKRESLINYFNHSDFSESYEKEILNYINNNLKKDLKGLPK